MGRTNSKKSKSKKKEFSFKKFLEKTLRVLGHNAWQGIGAIFAIFAMVWAIYEFQVDHPAERPSSPTQSNLLAEETPTLALPVSDFFEITGIAFDPTSPSNAEKIKIFSCTKGYGGVGITLKVSFNTASDGSDSGEWKIIKELGVPCFTENDAPVWDTSTLEAGIYQIRVEARGPETENWEDAISLTTEYTLEKP